MNMFSSRRPLFWIALTALSCAGIFFTIHFFTKAFPIANLELKMDRHEALKKAKALAEKYQWGPFNYQQSASFHTESEVQFYVELEAGGSSAFNEMIIGTLYSPYTWHVRHFFQGQANETMISFKPDGTPYEFIETIAENSPGAALKEVEARTIAEASVADWGVSLNEYVIVETSQEVRPNGRIDHTFVYERPTIQLGQARYRLRLVVTGNKFSALEHFIKIPEGFFLRFKEMRAANNTIHSVAIMALYLLYILFGCCFSLFILMRKKWVIWRQPALWALLLASTSLIESINELPLAWMKYDTATSVQNFLIQYVIMALMEFFKYFIVFLLSITAAESLTRRAFGSHIQLWSVWSERAASSYQIIGRTIGGYLIVGFDLAFSVGTYLLARNFFGWWVPSEPLVDPNIIATYVPWVSPALSALKAGFWEECIMRAVPLALAALIGDRYGKRKWFIAGAFVLQAIIFGAAHASYPTQPAYGRLLELIIPSFIFGGIYLVYGLLPAIISHVIFDLVLMSLPLFISSAAGSWINQGMVIIWGLVPLCMILYARLRMGRWHQLATGYYNNEWKVDTREREIKILPLMIPYNFGAKQKKIFYVITALVCVAWALMAPWVNNCPALTIDKSQARSIAQKMIGDRNNTICMDSSWRTMTTIAGQKGANDRFIWQEGGAQLYSSLINLNYLSPACWHIRMAKFEGDLEDRAQEFNVFLARDGALVRFEHQLPEKQAGAQLTQDQARNIALRALAQQLNLKETDLVEISATPAKLPARTDWTFIFSNPAVYSLSTGQARISVSIAGDTVNDIMQHIHMPQEWERHDKNKQTLYQTIQMLSYFLILLLVGIFALYALFTAKFSFWYAFHFYCYLVGFGLITATLSWPTIAAQFSTSEPLAGQIFRVLLSLFVSIFAVNGVVALLYSFINQYQTKSIHTALSKERCFFAFALGMVLQLIFVATQKIGYSLSPTWASFTQANYYLPAVGVVVEMITLLFSYALIPILLTIGINKISHNWSRYQYACAGLLIMSGFIIAAVSPIASLLITFVRGLLSGIAILLGYLYLLRFDPSLGLFVAGATVICLGITKAVYHAFPGALLGSCIGIILVASLVIYLYKRLNTKPTS
jgi:hypothetical protein